jgi:hypothetical protein
MYTLSFVSFLNKKESDNSFTQTEIETLNKEIQTQTIPTITKNTESQTENQTEIKKVYDPINYFEYEIDEERILNEYLYNSFSNSNLLSTNYCKSKVHLPLPCIVKTTLDKIPENKGEFENIDLNEKEEKYTNEKYSVNDRLIHELKQNLKTSNYGLRRRKSKYIVKSE